MAAAPSNFTNVKSEALVYTAADRLAYYTGGVVLANGQAVKGACRRGRMLVDKLDA